MNRAFKIRYLFCGRFDSQHLLKLLIGFNVFLGIYLLFLSANYRHYSDYSSAAHSRAESSKVALPPPAHLSQPLANYGDTNELNAPNAAAAKQALLVKEKNVIAGDGGGTNLVKIESDNAQQAAAAAAAKANKPPQSSAADQLNVVDKIYDSNNKLVVQEEPPDNSANPDASYKRVEEDDKTSLDENDKLRIEMMGDKSGNSIIHDSEFSGEKQAQPPPPKNVIAAKPLAEEASGRAKGAAGKMPSDQQQQQEEGAIISRILDHNQHIVNGTGGGGKLTVPDAPINSEGSAGSPPADQPWMTAEVRGKYAILRDYIPLTVTPTSQALARSITLTTQGTPDFLHHILPLVDRWEGLISVSVYAPGGDFRLAVNSIHYLRQCGPAGVGERVHWHLVYDTLYPPPPPPPTVETFSSNSNTSAVAPASAYLARSQHFDCNLPLDETMKLLSVASDFRAGHSLPYPINVLRNAARQAAKTHFLFASDIELYPSVGIVPAFFDLLDRERRGLVPEATSKNPHVYVLPIFEVKANKSPPRTKKELLKLFAARDAIFFHRYVCDLCQNFPDRALWVQSVPTNDSLNVFRVTRRLRERSQWEPLYIGTNDEPFYDERLTWDGKRDKMTQMFEMCLKNYDLFILDSAFLVHAPGIKYYSVKDDAKRLPFIKANQKVHNLLLSQLRRKYGTKSKC